MLDETDESIFDFQRVVLTTQAHNNEPCRTRLKPKLSQSKCNLVNITFTLYKKYNRRIRLVLQKPCCLTEKNSLQEQERTLGRITEVRA